LKIIFFSKRTGVGRKKIVVEYFLLWIIFNNQM